MMALLPPDEASRLEAVAKLSAISDEAWEKRLGPLVRLLAQVCEMPYAHVDLVDELSVRVVAAFGVSSRAIERHLSISAHIICSGDPLLIPDMRQDSRFARSEIECDGVPSRFCAGAPIRLNGTGAHVGSLIVMDDEPRVLRPLQRSVINTMALLAGHLIEACRLEMQITQFL